MHCYLAHRHCLTVQWRSHSSIFTLFFCHDIGWSMRGRTYTGMPLHALLMAVWRRNPHTKVQVHSYQGSQFTSMSGRTS